MIDKTTGQKLNFFQKYLGGIFPAPMPAGPAAYLPQEVPLRFTGMPCLQDEFVSSRKGTDHVQ